MHHGPLHHHHTTTVLRPIFWDHLGEPVPEENFCTLQCKGRLTEADIPTIRLGATPSRLTSAHLHHPPIFFRGQMPFLQPNQQHQSTEDNVTNTTRLKKIAFTILAHPVDLLLQFHFVLRVLSSSFVPTTYLYHYR